MDFNPVIPTVMHVDINSCFASIEQQANPLYRGRPVAVAAYTTHHGCILAASREAKRIGITTGMTVGDATSLYRRLIVLPPDPPKYRAVNRALFHILSSYSPDISVESIDEMVLKIVDSRRKMVDIAEEIKQRIAEEIGDFLTVSIGISTNRYLAKTGSNLHKPDGLDIIDGNNIERIFLSLRLEDLTGIKEGNANRLRCAGIYTPTDLLHASSQTLVRAFRSIMGQVWWTRLHGWEEAAFAKGYGEPMQKSFGQSFAMGHPHTPQEPQTRQIMTQLIIKMGRRLRADGFAARGFGVSCYFRDHTSWGKRIISAYPIYADRDFYTYGANLLDQAPQKTIRILAVWTYTLEKTLYTQKSLLAEDTKKECLTRALDELANRFGEFVVTPARMVHMEQRVLDRIAFGGV